MRKKKSKLKPSSSIRNLETKTGFSSTNITSNPPNLIETPNVSSLFKVSSLKTPITNSTPNSPDQSLPKVEDYDFSFELQSPEGDYSFFHIQSRPASTANQLESLRFHGVDSELPPNGIFESLNHDDMSSLNALSRNDRLLITEEKLELLDILEHPEPSGPYYFDENFNSKTDLANVAQKHILKSDSLVRSKSASGVTGRSAAR